MDTFEKTHEIGITNMGELLLKGYIMCAEACPTCNCPFFKKSSNSPMFCPLCDDNKNNSNTNKPTEPKETSTQEKKETIQTNQTNENSIQKPSTEPLNTTITTLSKKTDSINAKMSELLLAGWTLTNDNCPFCVGIPLMKNKEKQQFCVKCEKNFISEQEAKKQGMAINNESLEKNISNKEKSIPYTAEAVATSSSPSSNTTTTPPSNINKHSLDFEDKIELPLLPKGKLTEIDQSRPVKKEKIGDLLSEAKIECAKTSKALLQQLASLRQKLEQVNHASDPQFPSSTQYTVNLCDAISSVLQALNSCQTILEK